MVLGLGQGSVADTGRDVRTSQRKEGCVSGNRVQIITIIFS